MGELVLYNVQDNAETHSACLIVHGKCSSKDTTTVEVLHPQFPSLKYDVHNCVFKCVVQLSPGENRLTFSTDQNESKTITCRYTPLLQDEPVHLCLLVGRDSPLVFDSPRSQQQKEGGHDLDLAVRKLRLGARLMQAFTNEQMLRNGFGHRTFRFVEEYAQDTTFKVPEMRNRIKVHIIRSEKSVSEIRDPDLAQQNRNAKNAGGLFGIAMDALRKYGGPFASSAQTPVQAAVMFLDTHWDPKIKLITAHAALGGGDTSIKLAIFGSHGLFSWPYFIEDIPRYFTDETRVSTAEVANDSNECGTHWECFTLTLGAFMHEIGHLLGCPHQESGVMLRDYVRLNRSFLTKEAFSTRTNSYGANPPVYPREECTWHRLDLLKFLYHPSFSLPQDYYDPSMMKPARLGGSQISSPSVYALPNNCCVLRSETGIYCIQIICGDLARAHIEYLPVSLGGVGPQKEVLLSLDDLRSRIPPEHAAKYRDSFQLKVSAVNSPEAHWEQFPRFLESSQISMSRYGFSEGVIGMKSSLYGGADRGQEVGIIPFDGRKVTAIRVFHGGAIDGLLFFLSKTTEEPSEPPLPPRTYMGKITNAMKSVKLQPSGSQTVLFGKQTGNFSDVAFTPGEHLAGFNLRSGCWVDGVQVITTRGRVSDFYGNKDGGSQHQVIAPGGQQILGLYGRVGQWVDAIGIVYGSL